MIRNICALFAASALSLAAVACAAPTDEESVAVEESNEDLVSASAYFETFEGLDGKFYFHLMAGNGQNVLRSQGYTRPTSAHDGIASVVANGFDKRQFEVEVAESGDYYFNLRARNGEVIGTSQLYATKYGAERGARTVRALVRLVRAAAETPDTKPAPRAERFELFTGEDRQTYFRFRAANGEIVLSSEGYASNEGAASGIEVVVENGADASSFELFSTRDDGYGLRLVAGNGAVIARGETYASKSNAERAVARIAEMLGHQAAAAE